MCVFTITMVLSLYLPASRLTSFPVYHIHRVACLETTNINYNKKLIMRVNNVYYKLLTRLKCITWSKSCNKKTYTYLYICMWYLEMKSTRKLNSVLECEWLPNKVNNIKWNREQMSITRNMVYRYNFRSESKLFLLGFFFSASTYIFYLIHDIEWKDHQTCIQFFLFHNSF